MSRWYSLTLLLTVLAFAWLLCAPALAAGHQAEALAYLCALGVTGQMLSEAPNTFPDLGDAWRTEPSGIEIIVNVSDGSFRALFDLSDTLPFNQDAATVTTEAQAVARSLQFLNTYGEELGSSLSGLTVRGSAECWRDEWDVQLRHYEQGLPAEPGWQAWVATSGEVRTFVRYPAPSGPLPSPKPDITLEQAVSASCEECGLALKLSDWTLEICMEDDGQPHLVWALELGLPDGAAMLMDIDAHSGALAGTGVIPGHMQYWGVLGPVFGPLLRNLLAAVARLLQQ